MTNINRTSASRTRRSEAGMGGIEVLPIGVLVITIVSFVVISAWSVVDAKLAATAAAREAARTAVETYDRTAAKNAGRIAWAGHDRTESPNIEVNGSTARCGRIVVTVTADIETIKVPVIRSWGTITVKSVHSEVTDPYRNGNKGEATCA
jgi:Flp pilus assembly protein TadG